MGLQDLGPAVSAHLVTFPKGFFAQLGQHFLARYYRTFLDGPLAVAIVAEDGGGVLGQLVGILDPPRHRRLLLTYHGLGLAWWGLLGLLRRPSLLARFVGTRTRRYVAALRRSRWSGDDTWAGDSPPVAVLSHVIVAPEARHQGVGTALVSVFLQEATAAGCSRACLVTVAGSSGAGEFYEKRGWTHATTRRAAEGRMLAYYDLSLDA